MPSERQIAANRANAKRSTGPKTIAGKLRSSRNAIKHGLSSSAFVPADVIDMGSKSVIEKSPTNSLDQELVRAQQMASRVRLVRSELIAAVLQTQSPKLVAQLIKLDRYERIALKMRKKAMRRV
jgi:hypothetical protein